MKNGISIIYANRNKEVTRIGQSLISLQNQNNKNFEVIFVDYGSDFEKLEKYNGLLNKFDFVRFFPLDVSHLLWNKSKALNYGFKQASGDFIFVADVDLIFHPKAVALLHSLADKKNFFLFPLNYLSPSTSRKLASIYSFEDLKPERKGLVNGMILASKESLYQVWGLDEFFHFYGSEDEDLFGRLENGGYQRVFCDRDYFLHNWHPGFSRLENGIFTINPRVQNIMRINQRHFRQNMSEKRIRPPRQRSWGDYIDPDKSLRLSNPTRTFKIANILAHVEHFLNEELPSLKGEVVAVTFFEDPYYPSVKHKLKKLFGKQTQPYCSMKEVNDMVLKEILFHYRNENYSFKIKEDLKKISFCIEVK